MAHPIYGHSYIRRYTQTSIGFPPCQVDKPSFISLWLHLSPYIHHPDMRIPHRGHHTIRSFPIYRVDKPSFIRHLIPYIRHRTLHLPHTQSLSLCALPIYGHFVMLKILIFIPLYTANDHFLKHYAPYIRHSQTGYSYIQLHHIRRLYISLPIYGHTLPSHI